jgi:TPR repeat protein
MSRILSLISLVGCLVCGFADSSEPKELQLSSCERKCVAEVEAKALAGDIESARHAVTIYLYSDPSKVGYWTQIGAENGDVAAQRNLGLQLLEDSEDKNDHIRGVFWLEKAAKGGSKSAQEELARYRRGGRDAINPDPSKSK